MRDACDYNKVPRKVSRDCHNLLISARVINRVFANVVSTINEQQWINKKEEGGIRRRRSNPEVNIYNLFFYLNHIVLYTEKI